MRLSLKSVGIEFDHVSLRRSAIGKVVEELGVVIQARLYVTPRSRAGVGLEDVEDYPFKRSMHSNVTDNCRI